MTNNKVWQDGDYPELLMTNKFISQTLAYIHNNPVLSAIVDEPEYYWYSSVGSFCDIKVVGWCSDWFGSHIENAQQPVHNLSAKYPNISNYA